MNRTPLETKTETAVVRWAQTRGILVTKMAGNPSLTGWPDRCFWLPGGKPVLIEFKRRGARPRQGEKYQWHIQKQLRRAGYSDMLIGCVDTTTAIEWLIGKLAKAPITDKQWRVYYAHSR